MAYLTIGKMARLNNVSEQTLRLYDRMGLLSPCETGSNAYRYYNVKQCARLDMIQYMKSMGIKLNDIKKYLDSCEISLITGLLKQKASQIDEDIRALKYQKRAIERTINSFERYSTAPPDGTVLVEYIGRRGMYCVDSGINFYDYDIEVYEKILRDLKDRLIADHLPQIYFCNAGSIMRHEDFEQKQMISTEVFVFVDDDFVQKDLVRYIEPNAYLCIYCDSFDKEKLYIDRLFDAIHSNGYKVCGDYICEVISELPITCDNIRGMFLRLQVPIKFA